MKDCGLLVDPENSSALADALIRLASDPNLRQQLGVEARERALISGHADVDFTGLLVVTASSQDELAAAVKQVERAATQAGCETRVLYGHQSQGFAAGAIPIGRSTL